MFVGRLVWFSSSCAAEQIRTGEQGEGAGSAGARRRRRSAGLSRVPSTEGEWGMLEEE